jgi:diaminohydroxyphosphoribosylaminopyrimidine deaminase/5-amino-6-(5-phosphoribosylamino)uracil reductase
VSLSGVDPLSRALELAERGRGRTHPNPIVGAVVVAPNGAVIGEGWHTEAGGPHAEVVALRDAGGRARGATLYVTLEPCARFGRTPPCVDAIVGAGIARVVVGTDDPSQEGIERLRELGVEVELANSWEARQQNEAWLWWTQTGRPFVTYKVAITLDGRVTVPNERWISGEASRRLVHELRADSDAVAVGMGTVRADDPRLDARGVNVVRQPRRLAFGVGPLPEGSELELRSRDPSVELLELGADGVQSLLLEGGPTLATAFLQRDVIDKLLLFVAPKLSGEGPHYLHDFAGSVPLRRVSVTAVGDDLLIEAYIHEP